jgi:hypothetical protein
MLGARLNTKFIKIKTAFIIFAILVLSFICLRSGTATTGREVKKIAGMNLAQLPNTAAFLKQALRALTDKSPAGAIAFHPRKDWNSHTEAQIELKTLSFSFRGSDDEPNLPPPGQKVFFRVCDAYAYFYSQYQNGPKFHLFWPEEKREEGVLAYRKWLEAKISAERK